MHNKKNLSKYKGDINTESQEGGDQDSTIGRHGLTFSHEHRENYNLHRSQLSLKTTGDQQNSSSGTKSVKKDPKEWRRSNLVKTHIPPRNPGEKGETTGSGTLPKQGIQATY